MSYRDLKWPFLKLETCVDLCFQRNIPPPNWVGREEGVGVLYINTLSSSISIVTCIADGWIKEHIRNHKNIQDTPMSSLYYRLLIRFERKGGGYLNNFVSINKRKKWLKQKLSKILHKYQSSLSEKYVIKRKIIYSRNCPNCL